MFNYDYKDIPYIGGDFNFTAQALPSNKKTKQWIKDTLDSLETIGLSQIRVNRARFEDAYRIVEGSYKPSDIANTSLFLSEVDNLRNQSNFSEELKHYSFVEPIINTLIGEFIKKPNASVVYADDPISTNDYLRTRKDQLWERTSKAINAEIELKLIKMGVDPNKDNFSSEEERQQYLQELDNFRQQNIPEDVNKYMNSEWKPIYIDWAERTLESSTVRFSKDELDRDLYRDYLITGRCFQHWRVGFDYYRPERWSPLNTFTSIDQEIKYPELGDYVGRIQNLPASTVITNWGQDLNEEQKVQILKSKYYKGNAVKGSSSNSSLQGWVQNMGSELRLVPQQYHTQYENAGLIQEKTGIDLGYRGYFPNGDYNLQHLFSANQIQRDLVRTMEAYWVSYKRVGYLSYRKEGDDVVTEEVVTDKILKEIINKYKIKQLKTVSLEQHIKNPQENTIVWDYVKEVRYGVKISKDNTDLDEDLYLYGNEMNYQLRGESSIFDTVLPVTGIVENTSLVSRVENDQVEYSMAMNMARDYMSKELGVAFLMDVAYMPQFLKDSGGPEAVNKFAELARNVGLMLVDSTEARGASFNQFQKVDMDLTNAMLGKLQVGEAIRRRAYDKLGLSPERMLLPTEQTSATGVKQSVSSSFAQTEVWTDKFAQFQRRNDEMCINIAQWVQYEGKDVTVNYTDSDLNKHFISLNDPYLSMRRLRVYTQNNAKRRSELELLKQTYFQDNTIEKDLISMANVISADSTATILKLAKLGRQEAELAQAQAQQQQLQLMEQQAKQQEAFMEKEHQNAMEIEYLKGQIALSKQALLGLGFATDKDIDKDKIPDIVEQAKLEIDRLDKEFNKSLKERELNLKQMSENRQFITKQRELQLKQEELNTKQNIADKQLKIAKTNKNRYDDKN